MGIFDSDWQRLHKKISHRYELIALRNKETGLSPDVADMFRIITEIVRENVPNLSQTEAIEFVKNEYNSFKEFDVREIIRDALRQRNPDFQETAVLKFLEIARRRFLDPETEHGYFLFFVISRIIELRDLSISRGSYLIEIVRGRVPEPLRLIRFFQRWRLFAHYEAIDLMAKNRLKGETSGCTQTAPKRAVGSPPLRKMILAANLPYVVIALIFIGYFVFWKDHTAWPDHFLFWSWLPYVVHGWAHYISDGFQNTTRNIARIYLIKNHGLGYDSRLVSHIQIALFPDSMLPVAIIWLTAHLSSFSLLLFFQGWATAIMAEFGLILFGGLLPINYQAHLKRIYGHSQNIISEDSFVLMAMYGISTHDLTEIIGQAIKERLNPQQWWATVRRDAMQEKGR